jgi:hypothetical protein
MAYKATSPSRRSDYAETVRAAADRDGLSCFLCGHKHATVHTLQVDMLTHAKEFSLDNVVLACRPCAKRRNGKSISAYWQERFTAAAAELAHIETMGRNKDTIMQLRAAALPFRLVQPFFISKTGRVYMRGVDEDGNPEDVLVAE